MPIDSLSSTLLNYANCVCVWNALCLTSAADVWRSWIFRFKHENHSYASTICLYLFILIRAECYGIKKKAEAFLPNLLCWATQHFIAKQITPSDLSTFDACDRSFHRYYLYSTYWVWHAMTVYLKCPFVSTTCTITLNITFRVYKRVRLSHTNSNRMICLSHSYHT